MKKAGWILLDINNDDIPKMRDFTDVQLIGKYYKLLADNNMNPDEYDPVFEFKTEGEQTIISARPVRKKHIQECNEALIIQYLVKHGVLKNTNIDEFFNLQITRDGYTGTVKHIIDAILEICQKVK